VLIAPVNMLFNSKFVLFTLLGQGVSWITQRRGPGEDDTDSREAILTHAWHTVIAWWWGVSAFILVPQFLLVAEQVLAGLSVFPFRSRSSSARRVSGRGAERLGLFLTPGGVAPGL